MSNLDVETANRTLTPFKKRGVTTANGAANGTTLVSLDVPGLADTYREMLGEADGIWNDAEIYILTGDMKDQIRYVTSWVRITGTLTVDHAFENPKVSLLTVGVAPGALLIPVTSAAVFAAGEARIWDALNAETVTILTVDTVLNQLTIAGPGTINAYTVLNGAAISMSPRILPDTYFWIMLPSVTIGTVTIPAPTEILSGQVTLTGAAQQFPVGACQSVTIESADANAIVSIGNAGTVTLLNGYVLRGGRTVSIDIDNLSRIWVIGTVGQIITYIAVN